MRVSHAGLLFDRSDRVARLGAIAATENPDFVRLADADPVYQEPFVDGLAVADGKPLVRRRRLTGYSALERAAPETHGPGRGDVASLDAR